MSEGMILITGTNGGVGQFVANYLLSQGERNIICHYRSENERVLSLLKKFDLDPAKHSINADLVDEKSVEAMALTIKNNGQSIDRLVNVAGSSSNAMSWKMSKNDFMRVIEDSLLTSFLCSKVFIPDMREKKYGRIINFSSIVGFSGMPGASHYAAAKAGLVGFTKSLSLELANKNITVNALALGYFNAGLIDSVSLDLQAEIIKKIPAGRFGEEKDIGAAVKYLLSPEAQFLTGQVIHLNGGQY
jgi:3-oxoacyl-[acyl-carrier protein] reductase